MSGSEQEVKEKKEEEVEDHGFISQIVDAVMKPGTAPIIVIFTHCAFIGLLLVLIGVMVVLPPGSPVFIHVLVLWLLTAGLYAGVAWFLSTGITDPDRIAAAVSEAEKKKNDDGADKKKDDEKKNKGDDKKKEEKKEETKGKGKKKKSKKE